MKAYVIVDVLINDHERYEDYKKLTPGSLIPFDGKFIVRGSPVQVLEGEWKPNRLVILEFPSLEKANAWWNSDIYGPAKALRQSIAITQMIAVEGVA